jgi:hypothetical protein
VQSHHSILTHDRVSEYIVQTAIKATRFMTEIKRLMKSGFDSNARDDVLDPLYELTYPARQLSCDAESLSNFLDRVSYPQLFLGHKSDLRFRQYKETSGVRFSELKETTDRWHEIAAVDVECEKQIKEKARQLPELVEQAHRQTEKVEQEKKRAEEWQRALVLERMGKKTQNRNKQVIYADTSIH